jgi:hypothetical protein
MESMELDNMPLAKNTTKSINRFLRLKTNGIATKLDINKILIKSFSKWRTSLIAANFSFFYYRNGGALLCIENFTKNRRP